MKAEFIRRMENLIKQRESTIKEYKKSYTLTLKHKKINPKIDIKRSSEFLSVGIEKLNRVVYELFNVIDIYKELHGNEE